MAAIKRKNGLNRRDIASSIFLLLLAIGILVETAKMPIGSLAAPRLGLWPGILALFLAILSLILLGQTIIKKGEERSPFWARSESRKKVGLTVGALFSLGFIFEYVGYLISVFIFMIFLFRVIQPLKWWLVITLAIVSSLGSYLIFGLLLNTFLPKGFLGM